MRRPLLLLLTAGLFAPAGAGAVVFPLEPADVERALAIARGPTSGQARFRAQYVVEMDDATVERIEILTPFRRVELFGEDRLRIGDHMFRTRDAERAVAPWGDKITIRAQLRLNPMNVYVSVPEFDLVVGDAGQGGLRVPPLTMARTPIFGLPGGKRGHTSQPILGATVEAVFDAAAIGQQTWPVGIWLDGRMFAATAVKFGELE